jgi:hypothetical protein
MTLWPLSMDGGLYLVTDCNNVATTCVAGADVNLWGLPETMHYAVTATRTYYLVIDAYDWNAFGPYVLDYAITCAPSSVDQGAEAPATELAPGYPNPFRRDTSIGYQLATAGPLRLEVFDAAGRFVRLLADRDAPAGAGSVNWDGLDEAGRRVAAGTYFCRLQAGTIRRTRVLVTVN